MEANIINLEDLKDKETIETLVLKITRQINVNHIYLIANEKAPVCDYRFIIIIEDMAKRFKQRIKEILSELLETFPNCITHFYTPHEIKNTTSEGNIFFINHCKRETLIYYHHSYNENWLFHNVDLNGFTEKARENFQTQEKKITEFTNGAIFFLEKENYSHAAFMLHQSIEHSFLMAEYFLMRKTFTGHLISDHQNFLGNAISKFKGIFPRESETETHLLNKLNRAYCDSRYTLNYKITKNQVLDIKKKGEHLLQLVKTNFEVELHKCEEFLQSESIRPLKNTEEEQIKKPIENPYDKEMLEKIKELGEKNFLTLTPIKGGQRGYYLNYARVYDYFDLICLLRSTLNVCILALEDQQDCTLDIKNKECDVKAVLNFAKNLIPLEEANLLDKMRELLKPDNYEK